MKSFVFSIVILISLHVFSQVEETTPLELSKVYKTMTSDFGKSKDQILLVVLISEEDIVKNNLHEKFAHRYNEVIQKLFKKYYSGAVKFVYEKDLAQYDFSGNQYRFVFRTMTYKRNVDLRYPDVPTKGSPYMFGTIDVANNTVYYANKIWKANANSECKKEVKWLEKSRKSNSKS